LPIKVIFVHGRVLISHRHTVEHNQEEHPVVKPPAQADACELAQATQGNSTAPMILHTCHHARRPLYPATHYDSLQLLLLLPLPLLWLQLPLLWLQVLLLLVIGALMMSGVNLLVCDQVIDALPEPVLLGEQSQADSCKLREGAAARPAHATECTPCTWTMQATPKMRMWFCYHSIDGITQSLSCLPSQTRQQS
jgi:hypothetical protein